ncbi:hypothetical protein GCM10017779_58480 [Streptomyces capillispiralis]|nr:hypothetical protein GCM10017779_58480 [Streptomyces capillispiralis]
MLPGEDVAAQIVADLAAQILSLDDRLKGVDRQTRERFRTHPQAEIIESLPGMGPILGAESVVAAGDLSAYADAGHLASAAGLVPVPRDSGRRIGNLHRPKRYSRRLRRVFYLSAQTSIIREGPNRDFYLKKHGEGCKQSRPSLRSPAGAPVSYGLSCATTERSPLSRRSRDKDLRGWRCLALRVPTTGSRNEASLMPSSRGELCHSRRQRRTDRDVTRRSLATASLFSPRANRSAASRRTRSCFSCSLGVSPPHARTA